MEIEKVDGNGVLDKFKDDYRKLMDVLDGCDAPTDDEIKKLLTAQGVILQSAGYKLLQDGMAGKRGDKKIALGLKAYAESRECLIKASGLKSPPSLG